MAKASQGGMLQQHIEKFVVAGCVLILLGAIGYWGSSSPRQIEVVSSRGVGVEPATPETVNAQLREAALAVEGKINDPDRDSNGNGADSSVRRLVPRFTELTSDPLPSDLQADAVVSVPGRVIAPRSSGIVERSFNLAQLVQAMPVPAKPAAIAERELPRRPGEPKDELMAHVVATYPLTALARNWYDLLSFRAPILVVGVEAQVRERLPDGSWSEPRKVETVSDPVVDNTGQPMQPPRIPPYTGDNLQQIRQAGRELETWQQQILQPEFYQIWSPSQQWVSWRANLPANPISQPLLDAREAAEEERVEAAPARPTRTVTPPPARRRPGRRDYPPTPREREDDFGPPPGAFEEDPGPGGEYYEPMVPTPGPGPDRRLEREAPTGAEPAEVMPVPPFAEQMATGRVLVWFHDAGLEPMKTYQYRLRLVMVNPLLARARDAEEPQVARVPTITSDFSPWSEDVSVPQATEMFLTGGSPSVGQATVTVFTRSLGQWVSERFSVSEGEPIGGVVEVDVTNPATGEVTRQTVDFSTGAVAAKLDFDKRIPRGGLTKRTNEMIFLDRQGKLGSRVQALDEESARYQQLRGHTR
jgi:hypothetical protein